MAELSSNFSLPNLIHWGYNFTVDHSGIDVQYKKIFNLSFTVIKNLRVIV